MSHLEASGRSSSTEPKSRIRRPEAEQALISAVIELMDSRPIADITIHQIAHVAGVNFGYINRYFETRHNLFAVTTDVLADAGIAQFSESIATPQTNIQESTKAIVRADLETGRIAVTPIGVKRLQLIQYLVAAGVPAVRFVPKSKEVIDSIVSSMTKLGLDEELAHARALHVISMLWAKATLGPVLGFTGDELENAFMTFFMNLDSTMNLKK